MIKVKHKIIGDHLYCIPKCKGCGKNLIVGDAMTVVVTHVLGNKPLRFKLCDECRGNLKGLLEVIKYE